MTETDAALRTLAHNVRSARTRAGLSLDELGRRAKVSKGALVGLEKAQGNPNFATLVRLADTLGVSVSALMEGPTEGRVRVVSASAVMPLWAGERGSEARLMLTTSGPAPVEVWRWRLEPGEEYPSHPHQAGCRGDRQCHRGAHGPGRRRRGAPRRSRADRHVRR